MSSHDGCCGGKGHEHREHKSQSDRAAGSCSTGDQAGTAESLKDKDSKARVPETDSSTSQPASGQGKSSCSAETTTQDV